METDLLFQNKLEELEKNIREYNPNADFTLVEKSFNFSTNVHKDQARKSGEPFVTHPIEVAIILSKLQVDIDSIVAGILHDTVEDTKTTLEEITKEFGDQVAYIVDGVTKLSKITFKNSHVTQAENFRKMIIAMAKDIRVIMIKLADRLHNMRTLGAMPEPKQRKIAQETIDIYAPIAYRLGMNWIRIELEDQSLKYLKPEIYFKLVEKVNKSREEKDKYIEEVTTFLKNKIREHSLKCEVSGRPKHYYSIYKKMEKRNLEFEQINDVIGFRIILGSVRECYEALGILHSIWKPVPGRFKDYIAIPKANMYQSLHTTLIGPYGERVEVQARTREMHRVAEDGIAAHWIYKEGGKVRDKDGMKFKWLRQFMEWQRDLKDPNEFIETVKGDLFDEDVYVFTPNGDVKEFPRGATPVDFAYGIHTDIGNKCVGAKINGRIVPLSYKLQNGDTIDILTQENHHPNKDWLKFVVSSKAKTKIRQFIKSEERKQSKLLGKEILEKELRKYKLSFSKLEKNGELDRAGRELKFQTIEDLIVNLAYGKLSPSSVIEKLLPGERIDRIKKKEKKISKEDEEKKSKRKQKNPILVRGVDDILVRFGKCCSPLYGDPIVGYITRGRGVTVHLSNCTKTLEYDSERQIDVEWDKEEKTSRTVKIRAVCIDFPGLLALMSKAITLAGGNIVEANIKTTKDKKAVNIFEIKIIDTDHLYSLIKSLEKINGVISVERIST